jgi:hypothetical protein
MKTLLLERHERETSGSQTQVQVPKSAFVDFFGVTETTRVTADIFDTPTSEASQRQDVLLSYYRQSDTFRFNLVGSFGSLGHAVIVIEETDTPHHYGIWWFTGSDVQLLLDRHFPWQRAPGNQHGPGRHWCIVPAPGPRQTSASPDWVEGLDGVDEDAGWGEYPIDTLLIRSDPKSVFEIVRRIDKGSFVMNPEFQRAFIWDTAKQSKLIESVLMRIPLPVFYLAEDLVGRMIVVDGLQRLFTFNRFLKNELKLHLPGQTELHGKYFRELSPKLQNRVEDCSLVLYIVDAKVPERARLDIFDRVNSGVPLTRQQMRNSLYMGQATRFLAAEAESNLFRQTTGNSLQSNTMRDREFVNRFCAFRLLGPSEYDNKDEMDGFLARALARMNQLPIARLDALSAEFRNTLRNNFAVFGEHAFRKHRPDQNRRGVLNASLWDVMSTGLCERPEGQVLARAHALRERFFDLMDDEHFIRAITYGPNSANQVRHRFEVMNRNLTEVFDAHTP